MYDRFCTLYYKTISIATLPIALETAELLFLHTFQFGLPEDIASDWGVQSMSRVWKEFLGKLIVSLTSGYCQKPKHRQREQTKKYVPETVQLGTPRALEFPPAMQSSQVQGEQESLPGDASVTPNGHQCFQKKIE
ncbi:hypothetical protein P4O66_005229, partial [Electrophorus voltai]